LGSSSGRQERMRRIKVSFEDSEFEELRRLAEERGSSYSEFIREAVRRTLEQEREREEKEREAIERMEAMAEEYMLRTVRAVEFLRDEVGLLGSGLQEVKAELQEVEEKVLAALQEQAAALKKGLEGLRAVEEVVRRTEVLDERVARLEGTIGLLREEVSELRRRLLAVEASLRREKGIEAGYGRPREERAEAVTTSSDADFQIPSFIKDNPWVEILSRKGRS
jgi:hypothetical protein